MKWMKKAGGNNVALKFIEKFSPNERKIFYIMSIFVALALFDRFFLGPVNAKIADLDSEIEKQRVAIMQDQQVLAYQSRINAENQKFSQYFDSKIEDDDVVNADFLSMIERVATRSEVTLIKSNPTKTNKTDRFVEYHAGVDCSGSLEKVVGFMHNINSADELLKITQFNMSPKRGTSDNVNISMTIVKLVMLP